jgi:hypothetical protein
MPFNGSGRFNPQITFVPNTLATAEDQNTQDTDIASGLSNCITRDGQSPAMANIYMGGFLINNVADPLALTDAATKNYVLNTVSSKTYPVRAATSGGVDTATTSDGLIYWNYSYTGTKLQNIPSASSCAVGQQLIIKDLYGDSALNNISIIPQLGHIDNNNNYTINIQKQAITLIADVVSNNWVIV